jgi:pimeloyl-ACP methyl ester carboxylesterase
MTLNYKWEGYREDGPFILLLHEALGSIGQWKKFPKLLNNKTNLPVLVYERQGHGNSPEFNYKRDENYLHNYALIELPLFLKTHNLDKRKVMLYGHSDGGSIALLYASKFPNNVLSLITEAAHIKNEVVTINGINAALEYNKNHDLVSKLKKYHGDKAHDLFYAWADTWKSIEFYNWNISDDLISLSFPSLIIQGKDDQYGSDSQVIDIVNKLGSSSKALFIDECGHAPWKEKTEFVLKEVMQFIKQLKIV